MKRIVLYPYSRRLSALADYIDLGGEYEIGGLAADRRSGLAGHGSRYGENAEGTYPVTDDLEAAMGGKDLLVMAVPSVYVRQTAAKMRPWILEGQIVTNVAKGIEETTLLPLSEVIGQELPGARIAVLSGPSHAEEVSRSLPTTCVAGAADKKTAEYIQSLFKIGSTRLNSSHRSQSRMPSSA